MSRSFRKAWLSRLIVLASGLIAAMPSSAQVPDGRTPAPPATVDPVPPTAPVPPATSTPTTSEPTVPEPATPRLPASGPAIPVPPALKGPLGTVVKDLRRGPLLIHGNYCGIGNRPGKPPIDALDAACMRHDACTQTGTLPSCACDDRLRNEATAIAQDPHTPAELQAVAAATAAAMAVLICKVAPKS